MKNRTVNYTLTSQRRRFRRSDSVEISPNNYTGTSLALQLVSSTNSIQNKGDRKTGTPYSYSKTEYVPLNGDAELYTKTLRYQCSGSYGQPVSKSTSHFVDINFLIENAENAAITRLYDKVRGSVDLSIDAFQVRQTLNMIRKPLAGLASIAADARREARRRGLSKITSSLWLEYQYGWRPLLSTIYDTAKLMGRTDVKRGPQLFRAKDRETGSFSGTLNDSLPGIGSMSGDYLLSFKTYSKVYLVLDLDDATKAEKLAMYTSLNPLSILWELQPYSFVVDWFADISNYLRSMESAIIYKSSFKAAWGSTLSITETVNRLTTCNASTEKSTAEIVGVVKRTEFKRFKYSGPPRPSMPVINTFSDLSWQRLVSSAALLRSAMK